jgi:hypothetical protein
MDASRRPLALTQIKASRPRSHYECFRFKKCGSTQMPTGDMIYLSMAILMFAVFAGVLAWVSRNWKA